MIEANPLVRDRLADMAWFGDRSDVNKVHDVVAPDVDGRGCSTSRVDGPHLVTRKL